MVRFPLVALSHRVLVMCDNFRATVMWGQDDSISLHSFCARENIRIQSQSICC